jgi:hypothetical protein
LSALKPKDILNSESSQELLRVDGKMARTGSYSNRGITEFSGTPVGGCPCTAFFRWSSGPVKTGNLLYCLAACGEAPQTACSILLESPQFRKAVARKNNIIFTGAIP